TVVSGGVSSVRVTYGTSPSGSNRKQAETVTVTTEQNFPLEELLPGTKYYVTVEGTDSKGGTVRVPSLTFTTIPEPDIQDLSVISTSPNELVVSLTTITPVSVSAAYKSEHDTEEGSSA